MDAEKIGDDRSGEDGSDIARMYSEGGKSEYGQDTADNGAAYNRLQDDNVSQALSPHKSILIYVSPSFK